MNKLPGIARPLPPKMNKLAESLLAEETGSPGIAAPSAARTVRVAIESEDGSYLVDMTLVDALACKDLLEYPSGKKDEKGRASYEWPEAVNGILDRYKKIEPFGTINTSGDGWGWYY